MRPTDVEDGSGHALVGQVGVPVTVVVVVVGAVVQPDNIGPYIAAGAALIGVFVTWIAGNRRLKSESARLEDQFRHERRLDDRRELRTRFDAVVDRYEIARRAILEAVLDAESEESRTTEWRPRWFSFRQSRQSDVNDVLARASEETLSLLIAHRQLTLWLPESDEAPPHLEIAANALADAMMAIERGDLPSVDPLLAAAYKAFNDFIFYARHHVQADLPGASLLAIKNAAPVTAMGRENTESLPHDYASPQEGSGA